MITAYKKSSISGLKSVTPLADGDIAFVEAGGLLYVYILDIDSTSAESSPSVIAPNSGSGKWILQGVNIPTGKLYIGNVAVTATAAELNLSHGATGGVLTGAAGTKAIFYQDTAPSGWTILNTLDDKLLYITKGSAAGGQTGGGAHSTGAWSGNTGSHTLSAAESGLPAHNITIIASGTHDEMYGGGLKDDKIESCGTGEGATSNYSVSAAAASSGHVHPLDATWRPAAYCAIICTKS